MERSPRSARRSTRWRCGIGLIAQDRRDGLSGEHSIYDNAILADLGELSQHGFIDEVVGAAQGDRTCSTD